MQALRSAPDKLCELRGLAVEICAETGRLRGVLPRTSRKALWPLEDRANERSYGQFMSPKKLARRNRTPALQRLVWLALLLLLGSQAATAQLDSSWNGYVSVANNYRDYGLSQLESGVAVRAAVGYRHSTGFFVGASAANVDYAIDNRRETGRDRRVDTYVGYSWDETDWTVNAAIGRYLYPGDRVDYDYTQLRIDTSYRDRYFASLHYTDELLGRWGKSFNAEFGGRMPLPRDLDLSALIGHVDADDLRGTRYSYWNVGVSKVVQRFALDLRYHDTNLSSDSFLGSPHGDELVLSLSYSLKGDSDRRR